MTRPQPDPEIVARILEEFDRRCRESGTWLSGDRRVGEDAAAVLLGLAPGTLANRRAEGTGPPHYRLGGGGHRVTYNLHELAAWVAGHRAT
jgi:hypothetical protein